MDTSAENLPATKPSITDSAWFWLMVFSCVSLMALQLMDWKYNQRQARLERRFQGRQWAAEHGAQIEMNRAAPLDGRPPVPLNEVVGTETADAEAADAESSVAGEVQKAVSDPPRYSRPGRLLISLWPLRFLAGTTLCLAMFMLRKQRMRMAALEEERTLEANRSPTGSASSAAVSSSATSSSASAPAQAVLPVERGASSP